jgi:hypothetical protein
MSQNAQPLYRLTFDALDLASRFTPRFANLNKRLAFESACPGDPPPAGVVTVSRWPSMRLPEAIRRRDTHVDGHPDVFQYDPPPPGEVHWHQNFANVDLFAYYAGPLLAQDELQVLEHPALASVREALLERGDSTLVVEGREPTPILIAGVERRCALATGRDSSVGRYSSIYGNAFASADPQTVRSAVTPLRPLRRSNILAIEAPAYGRGRYTRVDIAFVLRTAFTGYLAARLESASLGGGEGPPLVVVHTGFWGCGAYGGNRYLMSLLQIAAAEAAGIDRLEFHAVDQQGFQVFDEALSLYHRVAPGDGRSLSTDALIDAIHDLGFEWGISDGT